MNNRILSHGAVTDYISFFCHTTEVRFEGLEEKTQARLLALGYSPAIDCYTQTDHDYRYELKVECAKGETVCELWKSPLPKVVHLGDLDDWLERASLWEQQEQDLDINLVTF